MKAKASAKPKTPRPASFDDFMSTCNPDLKEVAEGVRALVRKVVPKVAETINPWGVPTFESNGPMCFLMVGKKHVTFGFVRGTSLEDPEELLEGTGKNLRHVKLRTVEEVSGKGVRALVSAAAKLNKAEPMDGKKMMK